MVFDIGMPKHLEGACKGLGLDLSRFLDTGRLRMPEDPGDPQWHPDSPFWHICLCHELLWSKK